MSNMNKDIYLIQQKSEILIPVCGNDEHLAKSLQFKFAYDKLLVIETQLVELDNETILKFYTILCRYFRDKCVSESIRNSFGKDFIEVRSASNIHNKFVSFIREKSIPDHWFFTFICKCDNFSCLRSKEYKCTGMFDITLEMVNYLILEITYYINERSLPKAASMERRTSASRSRNN